MDFSVLMRSSLFPVTSFSLLLSKLNLWLPGSQSSCHHSCVSLHLTSVWCHEIGKGEDEEYL